MADKRRSKSSFSGRGRGRGRGASKSAAAAAGGNPGTSRFENDEGKTSPRHRPKASRDLKKDGKEELEAPLAFADPLGASLLRDRTLTAALNLFNKGKKSRTLSSTDTSKYIYQREREDKELPAPRKVSGMAKHKFGTDQDILAADIKHNQPSAAVRTRNQSPTGDVRDLFATRTVARENISRRPSPVRPREEAQPASKPALETIPIQVHEDNSPIQTSIEESGLLATNDGSPNLLGSAIRARQMRSQVMKLVQVRTGLPEASLQGRVEGTRERKAGHYEEPLLNPRGLIGDYTREGGQSLQAKIKSPLPSRDQQAAHTPEGDSSSSGDARRVPEPKLCMRNLSALFGEPGDMRDVCGPPASPNYAGAHCSFLENMPDRHGELRQNAHQKESKQCPSKLLASLESPQQSNSLLLPSLNLVEEPAQDLEEKHLEDLLQRGDTKAKILADDSEYSIGNSSSEDLHLGFMGGAFPPSDPSGQLNRNSHTTAQKTHPRTGFLESLGKENKEAEFETTGEAISFGGQGTSSYSASEESSEGDCEDS
eukprot:gene21278-28199_t